MRAQHGVTCDRFSADRRLERRLIRISPLGIDFRDGRPAGRPLQLVPDAVEDRLAQIRLKRAVSAMFESVDMFERLEERLLHKILRIGGIPRPRRQAPASPATKARQVSREQLVDRGSIALPRPGEQGQRRWPGRLRVPPREVILRPPCAVSFRRLFQRRRETT